MKFTLRHEKDRMYDDGSRSLVYGSDFSSMIVGRVVFMHKPPTWAKGKKYFASMSYDGSEYVPFRTLSEARKYIEKTFTREILGGKQ